MRRQARRNFAAALALVGSAVLGGEANSTPVTDGLMLWLDATDPATLFQDDAFTTPAAVGDPVGGWKDKSGNDFHATQGTVGSRPTAMNGIMNGQAGLRFAASEADSMLIDPGLEVARPFTAFVVNKYWGPTHGRTLQSTSANWLVGLWAGRISHYAEGWVSSSAAPIAFEGEVYVADTVSDVSETLFTANGLDMTVDPAPVGEPLNLALTGGGAFAEYSDADISEVLVYDRALSASELASVRGYLYDKYSAAPLVPGELNTPNFGQLGVFNPGRHVPVRDRRRRERRSKGPGRAVHARLAARVHDHGHEPGQSLGRRLAVWRHFERRGDRLGDELDSLGDRRQFRRRHGEDDDRRDHPQCRLQTAVAVRRAVL
jgi:hypothetical protein